MAFLLEDEGIALPQWMSALAKPQQREHEAEEAPRRKSREQEKVCHHGPQREKHEVVREHGKRQPRHKYRRGESQHVKRLFRRPNLTNAKAVYAQHKIGAVDDDKRNVKK